MSATVLGGAFLIWLLSIDFGLAQPIPENIKETIAFLFTYDEEDVGIGTGFFMMMREGEQSSGYLVTAKHVLMRDSQNYYPKLCMKLNNTSGGADLIPVDLSGPNASRVFVHDQDPGVDIAIIPLSDIVLPTGQKVDRYLGTSLSGSLLANKRKFYEWPYSGGRRNVFYWVVHEVLRNKKKLPNHKIWSTGIAHR